MEKVFERILLILFAAVLLSTGCLASCGTKGAIEGDSAPNFKLKDLDGQTVSLSDLRGKPVLINFWATWCYWCSIEMPYLEQIYREWSDNGLVLLAINVGESASTVRRYIQSNNLSIPVLLDTRRVVDQKYNITGYPTTFFIDKDGIIQRKVVGAFSDKESIEQHLNKIIP